MASANEEDVEFPILCETCLGENPYVRMTKERLGKECKVCARAFTIFRWLPGRGMRYKKTEICPTCAKLKNVCQTCILDLEHGLPVQVRDTALSIQDEVPREESNRRDYLAKMANNLEVMGEQTDFSGKAQPAGREMLKRMARKDPYYQRNRPHICSFFVKGQCTRGNECPYRHEMPQGDAELAKQNIVDRYHGNNDPVARRMLARSLKTDKLDAPDDKSITSLFVLGLDQSVTQADLRDHFIAFGELKSVVVVPKGNCAFINYKHRAGAEAAALAALSGFSIKDKSLKVTWGKPKPKGPKSELAQANVISKEVTAPTGSQPPTRASIPLPPGARNDSALYPSQDPTAQGAYSK
ncbi:Pre-mRNA-splicing factor slt11 [Coemansia sp. RSA 376]|nr:Pre-mRNA-splicing factor slt11 [Coemansia sp. S680]KAJ2098727.1 Pre-mRNA-splicing factor slt11 [Coemansia sp. S100]KAJ2112481.1 Pre-mRNA-splicing factor slt11 [Coemansia sp. RSA 922]KAJ2263061.1 Pre-mRNA-splicing factor slt11 [Coemansia sp. RSA 376]